MIYSNLRRGLKNGYWDLQVEKSGQYEIALYAWPKGSGAALSARFKNIQGRAVAQAKLKIGENEITMKTAPGDMSATFTLSLTKGQKPRLQSWFYNKTGKDLGGSYFVYVTRK